MAIGFALADVAAVIELAINGMNMSVEYQRRSMEVILGKQAGCRGGEQSKQPSRRLIIVISPSLYEHFHTS